MKKPNAKAYGLDNELWEKGGKKAYEAAYLQWAEYCAKYETKRLPGRRRDSPIHPSWSDYVAHFDPTDPTRSQGAFCRWSGIRASSLSAAKRKQIHIAMEEAISIWIEGLQKLEPNIPDWWAGYKERNPDDKDEYDPRKHCCAKFWKDWCNCMKK